LDTGIGHGMESTSYSPLLAASAELAYPGAPLGESGSLGNGKWPFDSLLLRFSAFRLPTAVTLSQTTHHPTRTSSLPRLFSVSSPPTPFCALCSRFCRIPNTRRST
jgi:hypothetical protein